MQSILVLTDWSDTALHAAKYACKLAQLFKGKRIILYHAYQVIPAVTHAPMVMTGDEQFRQEQVSMMDKWQELVKQWLDPVTAVESLVEETALVHGVQSVCEKEKIDLVVMGITGKSNIEKVLVGSNAISMIASCNNPLLIVPGQAPIATPKYLVLTTDLNEVEKLDTPLLALLMQVLTAKLAILNVAYEEHYSVQVKEEITTLHAELDKYQPEYHYISHPDTATGIHNFAVDNNADLIITMHKKQSFISGLFYKSISKKLAWHSSIPLLVLPAK